MNDYTPEILLKRCFRCGQEKSLSEFNKDKYKSDGYTPSCKVCRKQKLVKPDIPDGYRLCPKCQQLHPATRDYFYTDNRSDSGLTAYCKTCHNGLVMANKAKTEYRAQQRQYAQNRRDSNPELRELERQKAVNRSRAIRHTPEEIAKRQGAEFRLQRKIQRHNRRAKEKGLPGTLTKSILRRCHAYWQGCCAVCGRSRGLWHTIAADHWIPLADKRPDNPGNLAWNIIPLCHTRKDGEGSCNQSKGKRDPVEWLTTTYGKRKAGLILKRVETYFAQVKRHG